jgi:hypothetical protein
MWNDIIYDITRYDMIWYDMIWYDMWCDVIWYTWYDMMYVMIYIYIDFNTQTFNTQNVLQDRNVHGAGNNLTSYVCFLCRYNWQ